MMAPAPAIVFASPGVASYSCGSLPSGTMETTVIPWMPATRLSIRSFTIGMLATSASGRVALGGETVTVGGTAVAFGASVGFGWAVAVETSGGAVVTVGTTGGAVGTIKVGAAGAAAAQPDNAKAAAAKRDRNNMVFIAPTPQPG